MSAEVSKLPPMPTHASYDMQLRQVVYTADQMHAYALAALSAQQGVVGEPIVAAYERGAAWAWENGEDAKAYLHKAACDYEDKTSTADPV